MIKETMGKETSEQVAKVASKILRSGNSGKSSKTAAGSALSQTPKAGRKKK
jgi:hypothetical protein